MDLKTKKRIKNLPKFAIPDSDMSLKGYDPDKFNKTGYENFSSRWNNGGGYQVASGLSNGINAAFQFSSMKTPSNYAGDFIGKYGMNNSSSIDGFNYSTYNDINEQSEYNRMSQARKAKAAQGAMLGSTTGMALGGSLGYLLGGAGAMAWGGPIGLGVGLLGGYLLGDFLGGDAEEEEKIQMRIAQRRQDNFNEESRLTAKNASMRKKSYDQYGNPEDQNLFSAALGKEVKNNIPKVTDKKMMVHTAKGIVEGTPDAKVDVNEIIESKNGKDYHKVTGDPTKIDGEYADLKKGDKIASDILPVPGTNMSFAQLYPFARAMGMRKQFWKTQAAVRNMMKQYDNTKQGNLPGHWDGWESFAANVPGIIQSWRDYKDIRNEDINRVSLNPYNKYEGVIRDLMSGRSVSPYTQLRAITNEDAAQRYRIRQSSGLNAGQKQMFNIANGMNTKLARAKALYDVDLIRQQFAKENAEMLNNLGTSLMDSNLRAKMFNEQMNAQAHASKTQGETMAKRNMLDYGTQLVQSLWENKWFKKNYDLYAQSIAEKAKENRIRALGLKNNKQDVVPQTNLYDQWSNYFNNLPEEKRKELIELSRGQRMWF